MSYVAFYVRLTEEFSKAALNDLGCEQLEPLFDVIEEHGGYLFADYRKVVQEDMEFGASESEVKETRDSLKSLFDMNFKNDDLLAIRVAKTRDIDAFKEELTNGRVKHMVQAVI